MSNVSNPNLSVSRQDLADFYDKIFPYLGGKATAGFTPVGTVISVMGVTAPANYLACDGTVYNISDYPELARYFGQQFSMVNKFGGDGTTTFAVPDLRGEFLRGTGTNSHTNQGSGAGVGVHQDATTLPNMANDTSNTYITSPTSFSGSISNADYTQNTTGTRYVRQLTIKSTDTQSSAANSPKSVRPTNTSVLYCIATKNIYMNPSLDYSTDEKVVGSWIDGKPIYQKTLKVTGPTVTTQGDTQSTITAFTTDSVDSIIDCFPHNGHGNFMTTFAVGTYNNANRMLGLRIYANTLGNVTIQCDYTAWSNAELYITVRYTKTTDT